MKKLIVPFAAAFGLSLGLATGVVVMRAPKAVPLPADTKQVATRPATDSSPVSKESALSPPDTTGAVADHAVANADTAASQVSAAGPKTESATSSLASTKPESNPAASTTQGGPTVTAKGSPGVLAKSIAPARLVVKPIPATARPVTDSLIGRRLAQVFGAMQAKDAARVLEQMDDTDVRAILGSLSSKQQAAILGSFPTQRAATILQATLRTASVGGTE